jgi:hypothetical protein
MRFYWYVLYRFLKFFFLLVDDAPEILRKLLDILALFFYNIFRTVGEIAKCSS